MLHPLKLTILHTYLFFMDYKTLLTKYMKAIIDIEGIDFLYQIEVFAFTPDEWEALNEISNQIHIDLNS